MGWVDMSLDGPADLHVHGRGGITAAIHRSDILEPVVKATAGAIGNAFILMQDNARAQPARVYMTLLDDSAMN